MLISAQGFVVRLLCVAPLVCFSENLLVLMLGGSLREPVHGGGKEGWHKLSSPRESLHCVFVESNIQSLATKLSSFELAWRNVADVCSEISGGLDLAAGYTMVSSYYLGHEVVHDVYMLICLEFKTCLHAYRRRHRYRKRVITHSDRSHWPA